MTVAVKEKEQVETKDESNDPSYKELPHNIEAEQILLGSLLLNNDNINKVADFLEDYHFFEPVHQRIYQAIQTYIDRGMTASPITLKTKFDQDEALAEIGGAGYLARLVGKSSSIINIADIGRTIFDLGMQRGLINIGEDIVTDAFDHKQETTAKEQIEIAEQRLYNLASEGSGEKDFQSLNSSLNDAIAHIETAYKRDEKFNGIPTKYTQLDALLGGLQKSDLLILAGRPSMGKTALAVNVALHAAQIMHENKENDDKPGGVGFFSLEMSADQLATRLIAMESGVNSSKMRSGNISTQEFGEIVQANQKLHELPFYIDDTPALTISAMRTRARRLKRKHNLSLIVVDYLQLLRGSAKGDANRVQEVSEITQGLKAIAKELDLPVIALSQLSRAVEQREDKRPQLSDLRESGSIEQDADVVMFIFREEYYLERAQPMEGSEKMAEWQSRMDRVHNLADVIVAKHRNGPIGNVTLRFDSDTTTFKNYVDGEHLPDVYL